MTVELRLQGEREKTSVCAHKEGVAEQLSRMQGPMQRSLKQIPWRLRKGMKSHPKETQFPSSCAVFLNNSVKWTRLYD